MEIAIILFCILIGYTVTLVVAVQPKRRKRNSKNYFKKL
jgi:hypothetical protein